MVSRVGSQEPLIFIDNTGKQEFHNLKQMEYEVEKSTTLDKLMKRLEERASKKGLIIVDKDRSGNCMLYSLSDQLELVKNLTISPEELRQSIVQYLRDNPNWVSSNVFSLAHCHCSPYSLYLLIGHFKPHD